MKSRVVAGTMSAPTRIWDGSVGGSIVTPTGRSMCSTVMSINAPGSASKWSSVPPSGCGLVVSVAPVELSILRFCASKSSVPEAATPVVATWKGSRGASRSVA